MSRYKTVINNHDFVIQFWPAAWRGQNLCSGSFSTRCHLYASNGSTAQHAVQPRLSMENTTVAADKMWRKMSRRLLQMPGHF